MSEKEDFWEPQVLVGVAAVLVAAVLLRVCETDVDGVTKLDTVMGMLTEDIGLVVGCIDGMPG